MLICNFYSLLKQEQLETTQIIEDMFVLRRIMAFHLSPFFISFPMLVTIRNVNCPIWTSLSSFAWNLNLDSWVWLNTPLPAETTEIVFNYPTKHQSNNSPINFITSNLCESWPAIHPCPYQPYITYLNVFIQISTLDFIIYYIKALLINEFNSLCAPKNN